MRVLGIDPGLTRMGYGVVEAQGSKLSAVGSGLISTAASEPIQQRLAAIFDELSLLIKDFEPDAFAVERVFFNINAKTATGSIQSSGIALLIAGMQGAEVCEYSPLEVKQAVVGSGGATKDQVGYMVKRILSLDSVPQPADVADALAIAICHINSRKMKMLKEAAS